MTRTRQLAIAASREHEIRSYTLNLPSLEMTRTFVGACSVLFAAAACSGTSGEIDQSVSEPLMAQPVLPVQAVKVTTIDVRRSLAVTEQTILARFSLERVLTQLATQSTHG